MICNETIKLRRVLTALILVCLVATIPTTVAAAAPDQGAPGDWLTRFAGARTVGLGGAFVAVADEASGPLWNPAGIRWLAAFEDTGKSRGEEPAAGAARDQPTRHRKSETRSTPPATSSPSLTRDGDGFVVHATHEDWLRAVAICVSVGKPHQSNLGGHS